MSLDSVILLNTAQAYGTTPESLRRLEGGHFASVFCFKNQEEETVLRLLPPQEGVEPDDLIPILAWMEYLSNFGCPVVKPVRSISGELVTQISIDNQKYLVSAVSCAPGELAERIPFQDWSEDIFFNLGVAVGKMHRLSDSYLAKFPAPPLPSWQQAGNLFKFQPPIIAPPAISSRHSLVMYQIGLLPTPPGSWGLVHLDLHFANFFVDRTDARVTLFDFDDCACGWFVMDLAMLLFDWSVLTPVENREAELHRLSRPLIAGYRSQKQLDQFWLDKIPWFAKLLELNLFMMLAPGFDPENTEPWIKKFLFQREQRIIQDLPVVSPDMFKHSL
jgi:Ser/Thr protein kinase RdoA (MazF antagonist)